MNPARTRRSDRNRPTARWDHRPCAHQSALRGDGYANSAYGATWRRRLWFSDADLVAWAWAFLPRQVQRSDGSVRDVTGANLAYQVHPDHLGLVDEVIDWYDDVAAGLERTVSPMRRR